MAAKKKIKTPALPKAGKEIVQLSTKNVIYKGKKLDEKQIYDIIRVAKGLSDNYLLVDLIEIIENDASELIYHKATTLEALSYGKGMINAMDLLKRKIINITKMKL